MKHMTLEKWDREMAPFLAIIESRSERMKREACELLEYVKKLTAVPDFETNAFDKLSKSLSIIIEVEDTIKEALLQYTLKEKVK